MRCDMGRVRLVTPAVPPPYCHHNLCHAQNPAIRHELSFEMGQVHSDMALHFDNDKGDAVPVLPPKRPKGHLKSSVGVAAQRWQI